MGYFPLCINLDQASLILVGEGKPTREKLNLLLSFNANITLFSLYGFHDLNAHPQIGLLRRRLTESDLTSYPAFIVVGDVEEEEKIRISTMAKKMHIPVNVVDVPSLCTFYFPALITNGALTVSVSTGGKSPGAAAYLKRTLETQLPDRSGEILEWLSELRKQIYRDYPSLSHRSILRDITTLAFEKNRPLHEDEIQAFLMQTTLINL